jgi:TonB family protein
VIAVIMFASVSFLGAQVECDNLPSDYTGECESFDRHSGYRTSLSFKKGSLNGWSEQFYREGQVRYHVKYKSGLMHGKFSAYYESGKLMTEGHFKSGSGEFTSYHESGEKKLKGAFNASEPDREWLSYNENGTFKDSLKQGRNANASMLSYLLGESSLENERLDFFSDLFGDGFDGGSFFGGDTDSIFLQMQVQMEDAMRRMREQFENMDRQNYDTTMTWEFSDTTGTSDHFEYFFDSNGRSREASSRDGVVDFPDAEPSFPGGDSARDEFIKNTISYPSSAKINGEQGQVFVEVVVTEEGEIESKKIALGVSNLLNEEALRVVGEMPKWNPAMHNGKSVKSRCIIPVSFSFN